MFHSKLRGLGMIYGAALVVGVIFGAVHSVTAVPALVFTSAPAGGVLSSISNEEFYLIQHIIPTRIIIPLSLWLALRALVAVFLLALWTMAGVGLRSLMGS